jgi:hypothetical protein
LVITIIFNTGNCEGEAFWHLNTESHLAILAVLGDGNSRPYLDRVVAEGYSHSGVIVAQFIVCGPGRAS